MVMQEALEKAKSATGEQIKPAESALTSEEKQGCNDKTTTVPSETTEVTPEDRASKIKRLKSGFTMCKPPGTFLWPDMVMSCQPNKVVVQLEDLFSVPTPPSVSSSTASSSPHDLLSPLSKSWPLPNCPVKPLAERRSVSDILTAAITKPTHPLPPETKTQSERITSTAVITAATHPKTSNIDLNEMPCPHTCHREDQHEAITNNATPCLGAGDEVAEMSQGEQDERKEILRECEQKLQGSFASSTSSSTCLSRVSGT